jgi:hypothetical protein
VSRTSATCSPTPTPNKRRPRFSRRMTFWSCGRYLWMPSTNCGTAWYWTTPLVPTSS